MNECPVCGTPVPEGRVRCPQGHYQLGACVFCGTERAHDVASCPTCGEAWLDEPYVEIEPPQDSTAQTDVSGVSRKPGPSEAELTAATMRQPWRSPGDEEGAELIDLRQSIITGRDTARWLRIGRHAAIAAIAIALVGLASYALNGQGARDLTTIPTVLAITETHPITTPQPTRPPVTAAATTTAPATTTSSTTMATRRYVTPIGDPVAVNDLRLTIYGIGKLRIGDPSEEVAGVLTATFGQPDFGAPVEPAATHPGACPGSASRVLRWGILEITISNGAFTGYRLDASLGAPDSATAELRTASGLRVGATVSTLETIYRSYQIVYDQTQDFGPTFTLQRTNGDTLIWGPLTSTDLDGVVLGVYSRAGCD